MGESESETCAMRAAIFSGKESGVAPAGGTVALAVEDRADERSDVNPRQAIHE